MVESLVRWLTLIPPDKLKEVRAGKRLVKVILELLVFSEFNSGR